MDNIARPTGGLLKGATIRSLAMVESLLTTDPVFAGPLDRMRDGRARLRATALHDAPRQFPAMGRA